MALSSMTGFARGHGVSGTYSWAWERKSVNAKGLDLPVRPPAGRGAGGGPARNSAAQVLARGTVYGTLTAGRQGVAPVVRVNEPVLSAVLATINALAGRLDAAQPRAARAPLHHHSPRGAAGARQAAARRHPLPQRGDRGHRRGRTRRGSPCGRSGGRR